MLLLTTLVLALSAAPAEKPTPVYVFTAPPVAGFTDAAQQQRAASVADLQKALRKKHGLVVVADPSQARLQLEVTDSGKRDTGTRRLGRNGVKDVQRKTVAVTLRVEPYALDLKEVEKYGADPTLALAKVIDQWVKDNRAQLSR